MSKDKRTILNSGLHKVDTTKIRYDLIPVELLERLAKHYTKSLEKYPEITGKRRLKKKVIKYLFRPLGDIL